MKKVLLFAALFFAACGAPKPTNWAAECAHRFPPRTDTLRITTEKILFDTILSDTVKVPFVVKTTCPPSDTVSVVERLELMDCPTVQTVVKTRVLHDSIIVYTANIALENLLLGQLDSTRTRLSVEKRLNRSFKNDIAAQKRQVKRLTLLSLFFFFLLAFITWLLLKYHQKYHEKYT